MNMNNEIKERPILFSAPMVCAILGSRKTQTRRVIKNQPSVKHKWQGWIIESTDKKREGCASWGIGEGSLAYDLVTAKCPYGKIGDRLWVRERTEEDCLGSTSLARYSADGKISNHTWWYSRKSCPSIHMPRWASRILLEITNVRVEQLQDISEEDAIAEGVEIPPPYVGIYPDGSVIESETIDRYPSDFFKELWESINGPGSWDLNPWVWVVEFTRID